MRNFKPVLFAFLCLLPSVICTSQEVFTVNSIIASEQKTKPSDLSAMKNQKIPFNLLGGLIMVDAEVEGKEFSCIFDTGAPSIIINKDEDQIRAADGYAIGVSGKMKMKNSRVRKFEMGGLKKKNLDAIEIDISHIEEIKRKEINGILGVDIYENKEILIDYSNQELEILPKKHKNKLDSKEFITSVPFFMEDQLPVIRVRIGKRFFYFGVDTGAEVNVIDTRCLRKLKKCKYQISGEKVLTGVDKNKNIAQTIVLDHYKIKKQEFGKIEFAFMDMSKFSHSYGVQLDGILGYPFLSENLVSFDFRRSKLNFWKEKADPEKNEPANILVQAGPIQK